MSGMSEGEIRAALEKDVAGYFAMMKDTINRGRPGLVEDAETCPDCMGAADALAAKLIDDVATLDDIIGMVENSLD
jgi:ClpP class serine protease